MFAGIVDGAVRGEAAAALGDAGAGASDRGALEAVRAEFEGGGAGAGQPVFRVSQRARWKEGGAGGSGGAGDVPSYSEQLARLPVLAKMVDAAAAAAAARHGRLCAAAGLPSGGRVATGPAGEAAGDLRCMAVEMLLEALRWSKPKVLDRRDGRYVAA